MRPILHSPRARWAVPAAIITALGAAIGGGALIAGASSPDLPDKTAAELLADINDAEPQPFSGTVVQTSRLGLPDLPGLTDAGGDVSLVSLLTGSNTARIWYTSPEQARFSLMGSFDELTVIRDGDDAWMWSSATNEAEHLVLPDGFLADADERLLEERPVLPDEAAQEFLDELDPSTEITVDGTAEVAGRAAYELVASPRDERSLIDSVEIAVDAETAKVLRFELNGNGSDDPAFEVGFTSVTFTEPSADVYRFNPPPGAEVTEHSVADLMASVMGGHDDKSSMFTGMPSIVGEGWTSVAVIPGVTLPDGGDEDGMLDALLSSGTEVTGPYGTGRLFTTAVLSVLWLDDGTLLVGAVTPDVLEDAAVEVVP
jgi:outer membrane lipoprotein-sorting protein